jgi:hypothetical protein
MVHRLFRKPGRVLCQELYDIDAALVWCGRLFRKARKRSTSHIALYRENGLQREDDRQSRAHRCRRRSVDDAIAGGTRRYGNTAKRHAVLAGAGRLLLCGVSSCLSL